MRASSELEHGDELIRQPDDALSRPRLRQAQRRSQLHPFRAVAGISAAGLSATVTVHRTLTGEPNAQRRSIKINIRPLQSQRLALPQAKSEGNRPSSRVSVP